jgi:hypothetical protein
MLELQPVPLLSSLFYNSKIYRIEAKYIIWSLDGRELNVLQHRYYRESTFLTHKLLPSTSFKRGSHAPGLWIEFQAPPVSWSVCEYNIFIASILYSRKICLEYPCSLLGLHRSLASTCKFHFHSKLLHSPSTQLESP